MRRRAASRRSGFTLIEVQVALLAFGLLMAVLLAWLRFGIGAMEPRNNRAAAVADTAPAADLLSRILTDARLSAAGQAFDGEGDRVRLLTPLALSGTSQAIDAVTIDRAAGALRLRARGAGETMLLPGVAALKLRYYGISGEGPPRWREAWHDATRLPSLVELVAISTSGRQLFAVLAAPRVTGSP